MYVAMLKIEDTWGGFWNNIEQEEVFSLQELKSMILLYKEIGVKFSIRVYDQDMNLVR